MTADSAHKTLPALTGAAYLQLKNPELYRTAKTAMNMFGSSSPSYLIMDSLDLCNRFIAEEKGTARAVIKEIGRLKERLGERGYSLKKSDPMRITLDTAEYGYSGSDFAEILRNRGAECEMCDEKYVVLLFSVSQNVGDLERLYEMLCGIERKTPVITPGHKILRPEKLMSPRKAYFSRKIAVKTEAAEGEICGGVHTPCPPCVPLVMPGERINGDCVRELLRYGVKEMQVIKE